MSCTLTTARSRLIPVVADDADRIGVLLRQPAVRRYLCDDALVPHELVAAWIAESRATASVARLWRIALPQADLAGLVGLATPGVSVGRLRPIGWRSLELTIALEPAWWGRGLATEAIDAVARHAGSDGVTFALLAAVDVPNERSHRLMARSGFAELGRVPGPRHELVVYERAV